MSSTEGRLFLAGTPSERFERRLRTRLDAVEDAVQDVYDYARRRAQRLSDALGQDPEYYLGVMFDWGAFLHPMPKDTESDLPGSLDGGLDTKLDIGEKVVLRQEFVQEFNTLTSDHRRILSNFLQDHDARRTLAIRSLPCDRADDVNVTFDTIKALFLLLKCRCGVDGFVCLVMNDRPCSFRPEWFFSDPDLNTHLLGVVDMWDADSISYHVETFSRSGRPQMYATWMRKTIEDKINMLLVQVTGRRNVTVDYENYEKAVLIDLGVELVGWTHETFARPSTLPLDIMPLEKLLRAVNTGACFFRRRTKAECADHLRDYMQRMGAGSPTAQG
ncbi:hypothetical protein LXA43DRAFT_1097239 [Ganoderma leucocontextum]|nr:hypothetical protein LXA43DRAFT_1097239 [Ganoderma leucocontextum]